MNFLLFFADVGFEFSLKLFEAFSGSFASVFPGFWKANPRLAWLTSAQLYVMFFDYRYFGWVFLGSYD